MNMKKKIFIFQMIHTFLHEVGSAPPDCRWLVGQRFPKVERIVWRIEQPRIAQLDYGIQIAPATGAMGRFNRLKQLHCSLLAIG